MLGDYLITTELSVRRLVTGCITLCRRISRRRHHWPFCWRRPKTHLFNAFHSNLLQCRRNNFVISDTTIVRL